MTQQPDTLTDTLTTALDYAARGWRVFPLLPGSKRPATPNHRAADCDGTDAWCRTGHAGWEQRATNRPDWITRAWSSNPAYGVGIACGPSQLVVVDLDTHKLGSEIPEPWKTFEITTGEDVLDHLAGVHGGTITPTFTVRTPSNGIHLYYQAPEGVQYSNTAGAIGWLVDTRAHGGYVAAPPTTIGSSAYDVIDDRPPAPLPWFLLDLLSQQRRTTPTRPAAAPKRLDARAERVPAYVAAAVNGEAAKVTAAMPGQHNYTLFCAAVALGQLVAGGALSEHTAYDALTDAAHVLMAGGCNCTPGEVDSTIRSGFATGARNPRTPSNNSRKAA